jgi:hypothetical protein
MFFSKQRDSIDLANVRNPDVAGVHSEYDFNMQIAIDLRVLKRTVDKSLE